MQTIAVLIASYNRKSTTLRCLSTLVFVTLPPATALQVYLVDDASPDGTAEAVRCEFPAAHVFDGTGQLYWGGGMRRAFDEAMKARPDFYLWLNDDVELSADALARLIDTHRRVAKGGNPCIIVGTTRDPERAVANYGGQRRQSWNPLRFSLVVPDPAQPFACETMNGNVVLIPAAIADKLGNIDPHFTQQMGDLDYGLRAHAAGVPIWVAPGFSGTCVSNIKPVAWKSADLPFAQRWRMVNTVLGLPFGEWMRFAWRHGGLLGVLAALAGYRGLFFPKAAARQA